jgi:hypothetical protein
MPDSAWAGSRPSTVTGAESGLFDGYRDGKRFIVRADEKLPPFLELEAAIPLCAVYEGNVGLSPILKVRRYLIFSCLTSGEEFFQTPCSL